MTVFSWEIYTKGVRPRGGAGEAAAWVPAIAYLTAMRLEEIAMLPARQFNVDVEGNAYYANRLIPVDFENSISTNSKMLGKSLAIQGQT